MTAKQEPVKVLVYHVPTISPEIIMRDAKQVLQDYVDAFTSGDADAATDFMWYVPSVTGMPRGDNTSPIHAVADGFFAKYKVDWESVIPQDDPVWQQAISLWETKWRSSCSDSNAGYGTMISAIAV